MTRLFFDHSEVIKNQGMDRWMDGWTDEWMDIARMYFLSLLRAWI